MTALEIRNRIIDGVAKTGGHLASSLGAVELAMALAKIFDPERDRVVWDVGHQAYAWKILTGRADCFETLRRFGGLSGFPNPLESTCDAAISGHAGVALSVACGLASARDRKGSDEQVIAVVGDAAMANGVSFEALNNLNAATSKVIVVLNDNEMSISRPTGSFARFLGRLITGVRYNRVKNAAEKAGHALKLSFLRGIYHAVERRVKSLFLGNAFFEQFGLRYIGPVDGHDLAALESALTVAKEYPRSVLLHIVTKKGRGFAPAEKHPTAWHGVGPFSRADPYARKAASRTWSDAFGDALCELAADDSRIVALTAAMTDGTGLKRFSEAYPSRLCDVGIAEEHMTAFAGGLAAGGMRPVVAVYSTFLQRAVDQVMHDVCIANLPVVFCVDRAGAVGADGVTHQGLYDIAMLRCLPNLTICQPKDEEDLRALLSEALARKGPTVIRYPRGKLPDALTPASPPHARPSAAPQTETARLSPDALTPASPSYARPSADPQTETARPSADPQTETARPSPDALTPASPSYARPSAAPQTETSRLSAGPKTEARSSADSESGTACPSAGSRASDVRTEAQPERARPRFAIWATGDWLAKAREVAARAGGVAVHARYLKPFDAALLARQRAAGMRIVSLENGSVAGGFGEAIGADVRFGWPDRFLEHGSVAELERACGLDVESLVTKLNEPNG